MENGEKQNFETNPSDSETEQKKLECPEKVTIKWLYHNVPVRIWITFVGLLFSAYMLGIKTSPYLNNTKNKSLQVPETRISNTGPNITSQIEIVTNNHNKRIEELHKKYLNLESEAVSLAHIEDNQKKYIESANRIKDLIYKENKLFQVQIKELIKFSN